MGALSLSILPVHGMSFNTLDRALLSTFADDLYSKACCSTSAMFREAHFDIPHTLDLGSASDARVFEAKKAVNDTICDEFGKGAYDACVEYSTRLTPRQRLQAMLDTCEFSQDNTLLTRWRVLAKKGLHRGQPIGFISGELRLMGQREVMDGGSCLFLLDSLKARSQSGDERCWAVLDARARGNAFKFLPDHLDCGLAEPSLGIREAWVGYDPVLLLIACRDIAPGEVLCVRRKTMWRHVLYKIFQWSPKSAVASLPSPPTSASPLPADAVPIEPHVLSRVIMTRLGLDADQLNRFALPKFHGFDAMNDSCRSAAAKTVLGFIRMHRDHVSRMVSLHTDRCACDDMLTHVFGEGGRLPRPHLRAIHAIKQFYPLGRLEGRLWLVKEPCEDCDFLMRAHRLHGLSVALGAGAGLFGLYLDTSAHPSALGHLIDSTTHDARDAANVGFVEIWDDALYPSLYLVTTRTVPPHEPLRLRYSEPLWHALFKTFVLGRRKHAVICDQTQLQQAASHLTTTTHTPLHIDAYAQ